MRGHGMFNSPGVFYSMDPMTIFNSEWMLDHFKIASLKQHKLSILDFSSEHYGSNGLEHVYTSLAQLDVNFILLVHDPTDHLKFPRMVYYPHWYYRSINEIRLPKEFLISRNFLWSCQNSNPRIHRIYNYLYAKNSGWIKKSIFTMHNDDLDAGKRDDDYNICSELLDQWEDLRHTLPDRKTLTGMQQISITGSVFTDAYVQLITEATIIPKVFISEKTWKVIAAQQLFLIFGNPGTIESLRLLGVDTYDDIVDHSYDCELNWKLRLEKIYNSLQKLEMLDLQQIYRQTAVRRARNAELCLSGQFGQIYNDVITTSINHFVN